MEDLLQDPGLQTALSIHIINYINITVKKLIILIEVNGAKYDKCFKFIVA